MPGSIRGARASRSGPTRRSEPSRIRRLGADCRLFLLELGLNDRPVAGRVRPLGAGDADPLAIVDRHDPHDLAILVGQQGDPNVADQRRLVPVAPAGRAIRKIKHDVGHARVLQTRPDLFDQILHAEGLAILRSRYVRGAHQDILGQDLVEFGRPFGIHQSLK